MPRTGHLARPDGRVRSWGAGVVDRVRAAGQDDRASPASFQLVVRGVEREQLRVDVELADAPGDQLRELAPEVEDDDRPPGRRRRPGRSIVRRAVRRGRVERGLEIGLDLGVVRGEDAVAGVGGLTVDGLAALLRRRVLVAQRSSSRRSVRLGSGRPLPASPGQGPSVPGPGGSGAARPEVHRALACGSARRETPGHAEVEAVARGRAGARHGGTRRRLARSAGQRGQRRMPRR